MTKLYGKFTKIIFQSKEKNFFVVSFKLESNQEDAKKELDISDKLNNISLILTDDEFELKTSYEVYVEKKYSAKYKDSYYVKTKTIVLRNDYESSIYYLSSKLFLGISKKTATKVVDAFGYDFFKEPEKYSDDLIKLIGKNKSKTIIDTIYDQNEYQTLYKTFLDNEMSIKILDIIEKITNKKDLISFLENDIYKIFDYISQFDYFDLDKIAKYFYKSYSEKTKKTHLIIWVIKHLEHRGSTIIDVRDIFKSTNQYMVIDKEEFLIIIKDMVDDNQIIIDSSKHNISLFSTYEKEKFIIDKLLNLSKIQNNYVFKELIVNNLDQEQQEVLKSSLNNSFSIITGYPGTGKTLLIKTIVQNLRSIKKNKFELLAPTGKAATQISLKTQANARTVHSFLKYNKLFFEINKQNPSMVEILIIDEFSMINIDTLYSILIAVPNLKHLIIIGDKNQLPSIGSGYLLNDFIKSEKFYVGKLKKIYRQNEGSSIIENAILINKSIVPKTNNKETFFIEVNSNQIHQEITNYFENALNENIKIEDQQILISTYIGENGIDSINLLMQNIYNKNSNILFQINEKKYYQNDKVIQLENDIDKNIFNGEIGYIDDVIFKEDKIEKIIILFNNRKIEYSLSEFNENIKLAYATSIHKFQGSECPNIVLIMTSEHNFMLNKKLFYTAYTRAIKKITIIGDSNAINHAIKNDGDSNRKCNILELLK